MIGKDLSMLNCLDKFDQPTKHYFLLKCTKCERVHVSVTVRWCPLFMLQTKQSESFLVNTVHILTHICAKNKDKKGNKYIKHKLIDTYRLFPQTKKKSQKNKNTTRIKNLKIKGNSMNQLPTQISLTLCPSFSTNLVVLAEFASIMCIIDATVDVLINIKYGSNNFNSINTFI